MSEVPLYPSTPRPPAASAAPCRARDLGGHRGTSCKSVGSPDVDPTHTGGHVPNRNRRCARLGRADECGGRTVQGYLAYHRTLTPPRPLP